MPSYVSTAEGTGIRQELEINIDDTFKAIFGAVAWQLLKLNRPGGWDAGTVDESWSLVASGSDRLRSNSGGQGPVIGEGLIWQQAQFRMRMPVAAFAPFRVNEEEGKSLHAVAGALLIVDGKRVFKVDHFDDRGGLRTRENAYLTEIFDMTMPEVTP